MVRAALTPIADSSQFSVEWLYRYFENYAENAPHIRFNKLNITDKQSVWKSYVNDFHNNPITEKVLNYSSFLQLWNAIFPEYVTRRWVNIPGKCDTCEAIDKAF